MRINILHTIVTLAALFLGALHVQASPSKVPSVSFQGESVEQLIGDVLEQSGYQLVIPESFYSMKVTGEYRDVSIDDLLKGVLKGINYATVTVDEEQVIIVTIFGTFNGVDPKSADDKAQEIAQTDFEQRLQEMGEISKRNEEELNKFLNNPNSLDPLSNISFAVIQERVAAGEEQLRKFVEGSDSIDPFTGVPIVSSKKIAQENNDALNRFLNNPASLDPFTGIPLNELRDIAQSNEEELAKEIINSTFQQNL